MTTALLISTVLVNLSLVVLVIALWLTLQRVGHMLNEFGRTLADLRRMVAATNQVLSDQGYGDDSDSRIT